MKRISQLRITILLVCLALFNLSAYSQEQTNENIIMSGATVFVDLNKNRILDNDEPLGKYQGGNRYSVHLTEVQADNELYKEGLATLNIIGGIELDLGQDSTFYLNAIVKNNPQTSITVQVLKDIVLSNELKTKFTQSLNEIDNVMQSIRSTIPEFLSLNLELKKTPLVLLGDRGTSNKALNKKKKAMRNALKSHRKVLVKSSNKLNSKIKRVRKLANKNKILEITQSLNALIQSGVLVNNDFKRNVHRELVRSVGNLNNYWKKVSTKLSGEDSLVTLKGVETDIKLNLNVDATPPTLSSTTQSFTLKYGYPFDYVNVTAMDKEGINLTVTKIGDVNISKAGNYEIVYTATDAVENSSSITHTYIVNEITMPTFNIKTTTVHQGLGRAKIPPITPARDHFGKRLRVQSTGSRTFATPGTYYVTFYAIDALGNRGEVVYTFIVADIDAPKFSSITQNFETTVGAVLDLATITAVDDLDGNVTVSVNGDKSVDFTQAGIYTVTYTVTDATGNSDSITHTYVVATLSRLKAIKLLRQASFISREEQIQELMVSGEEAWIDKQLNLKSDLDDPNDDNYGYLEAVVRQLIKGDPKNFPPSILDDITNNYPESAPRDVLGTMHNSVLLEKMFESEDQLRHRMTLALSQLVVVSKFATAGSSIASKGEGLVKFYDDLYKNAFGNYRDILKNASMSPAMAYYLTFVGNKKEDNATNTAPDENYARELMQLFSIGIYNLNLDGTKIFDANGNPTPSYTQDDVSEMAKVFTGWDWYTGTQSGDYGHWGTAYGNTAYYVHNVIHYNRFTSQWHEYGEKNVLGQTIAAGLDGEADIDRAIDILMSNPNMAPHVSRSLITRFVTSNPSPAYIERVATVFNNNGKGIKGDLKATIRAILVDDEARGIDQPANFGKVDEFLLAFTHFASRFKVRALPCSDNGYNFQLRRGIAQMPLTAPSVFNFYSDEYVPSSQYFANNKLVAPELEVRTDGNLKAFSQLVSAPVYDKYEVVDLDLTNYWFRPATTMQEWCALAKPSTGLMYDSEDVYQYYESIRNGNREEEMGKLIDFLANKLLGEPLADDYKAVIVKHLLTVHRVYTVKEAKRAIVSSSQFMILK